MPSIAELFDEGIADLVARLVIVEVKSIEASPFTEAMLRTRLWQTLT